MSNGPSSPTGSGAGRDPSPPRSWAGQDRSPTQDPSPPRSWAGQDRSPTQDSSPPQALEHAQARERELRARLAELVTERRRLLLESERLQGLGQRPGADLRLDDVVVRYRAKAEQLGRELETLRSRLRAQEAIVAERKADADGV